MHPTASTPGRCHKVTTVLQMPSCGARASSRDLLSCVAGVSMTRLAAHGHSMGVFVTGQLLGASGDFLAGLAYRRRRQRDRPECTRLRWRRGIRTPYQLHHGDADTVVRMRLDQALQEFWTRAPPRMRCVYPGYTHEQMALDAVMFSRVRDWYRAHGVL